MPIVAFPPFRLELDTGELWRGPTPVALRPKAAAVLAYLAGRPRRLVSNTELLDAVWGHVAVSDIVLKVCVNQVRKALGDNARIPRFIETVHRRGYRFVASSDRTTGASASRPPSRDLPAPGIVVGRDVPLAELRQAAEETAGGSRRIVFVTGEPGIGKTTVLEAFLAGCAAGIWIGRGQCIEQVGPGEAFLPVLDALARLCRDVPDGRVIALLRAHAPSWLLRLPGVLGDAEREALQRAYGGVPRERMLREMVGALERLSAEAPLVLAFEDLHWSDDSTLELLAAVARRREPARLLVVGTYRIAEAGERIQSLTVLTHELRLHRQCSETRLAPWSEGDVEAYLRTRFGLTAAVGPLTRLVCEHTEGNPLFVVNAVEHLLARGAIEALQARQRLRVDVDAVAREVPRSLRQLIDLELGRLEGIHRRVLEAASVAGQDFPILSVVAALDDPLETIEQSCRVLEQRHRLLQRRGVVHWPDGSVGDGYAFRHALYRDAIYDRIAMVRRRRLHRRIGERLENGWGERARDIASELAVHFEGAGDGQRAVHYRRLAGEQALERGAYREAVQQFEHGLAMLGAATDPRDAAELPLRVGLGVGLLNARGFDAPEVERTFTRALTLCRKTPGTRDSFPVIEGLHTYCMNRGDYPTAQSLARQMLRLAQDTAEPALLIEAAHTLGCVQIKLGRLVTGARTLRRALRLYTPARGAVGLRLCGHDPKVCCLGSLGLALWYMGYPDQALHHAQRALAYARTLEHAYSVVVAAQLLAWIHLVRGENAAGRMVAEEAIGIAAEHGFAYVEGAARLLRGWALAMEGAVAQGCAEVEAGLARCRSLAPETDSAEHLILAALVDAMAGKLDAAREAVVHAAAAVDRYGDHYLEPVILFFLGRLLLVVGNAPRLAPTRRQVRPTTRDDENPEQLLQRAMQIAHRRQARMMEVQAASALAGLWHRTGKTGAARHLLRTQLAWFTEGFEVPTLREATRLLATLDDRGRAHA